MTELHGLYLQFSLFFLFFSVTVPSSFATALIVLFPPLSSSSLATCPLSGNVRRKQRSRKSTCETRVRLTDSHGYCHNDCSKMSDSALSTFCTLCFFLGYPAQDLARSSFFPPFHFSSSNPSINV